LYLCYCIIRYVFINVSCIFPPLPPPDTHNNETSIFINFFNKYGRISNLQFLAIGISDDTVFRVHFLAVVSTCYCSFGRLSSKASVLRGRRCFSRARMCVCAYTVYSVRQQNTNYYYINTCSITTTSLHTVVNDVVWAVLRPNVYVMAVFVVVVVVVCRSITNAIRNSSLRGKGVRGKGRKTLVFCSCRVNIRPQRPDAGGAWKYGKTRWTLLGGKGERRAYVRHTYCSTHTRTVGSSYTPREMSTDVLYTLARARACPHAS
jgi:hypothetical protein